MCAGLAWGLVSPSPKAQFHDAGTPAERSVNWTSLLIEGTSGEIAKSALTGTFEPTVTICVSSSLPEAYWTRRVTGYVPTRGKECEASWDELVPPPPKVHDQLVTSPLELSEKATVSPSEGVTGDQVKRAARGTPTFIHFLRVLEPLAFFASSLSSYVPATLKAK